MRVSLVLTVAQSKRLIARGVARLPEILLALELGTIAIGRGTTNGYVAEELLGVTIPKGEYVAGRTLPSSITAERLGSGSYPDIVLRQGQCLPEISLSQAISQMRIGDVVIKGGNALNYQQQLVGVLIGHPTGGTTGDNYGTIISRKIHLIIPIGLEKLVYEDINELSRLSREPSTYPAAVCIPLFPITGTIITEIEAFALLTGVKARLLSAGGVGGAEGAVWLLLDGTEEQLDAALVLYQSLTNEPPFPLKD